MSNPNYIHTITHYHKEGNTWSRTVYDHCFWKAGVTVVQNGTEASQANTYTVRIPLSVAGKSFQAATGDIVVHGVCEETVTGKSPNTAAELMLRHKPEAFKVTAFSDNTAHRMGKHFRLGG